MNHAKIHMMTLQKPITWPQVIESPGEMHQEGNVESSAYKLESYDYICLIIYQEYEKTVSTSSDGFLSDARSASTEQPDPRHRPVGRGQRTGCRSHGHGDRHQTRHDYRHRRTVHDHECAVERQNTESVVCRHDIFRSAHHQGRDQDRARP